MYKEPKESSMEKGEALFQGVGELGSEAVLGWSLPLLIPSPSHKIPTWEVPSPVSLS